MLLDYWHTFLLRAIRRSARALLGGQYQLLEKTPGYLVQRHSTRDRVQKDSLLWYCGDVYSQRGQDGILREIFARLGIGPGTFVEFGGWDGLHLANCRLLFEKGWQGAFIEPDPARFAELKENYNDAPSIVCLQDFVSAEQPLDALLRVRAPHLRPDFVSIDVDGLDLDIAIASHLYAMGVKVVLIEGNFNFDPRVTARIPAAAAQNNVGQPIAVMIEELREQGFEPVCFFQDLYLVRKELVSAFAGIRRDPVALYKDAFFFMGEAFREEFLRAREKTGAPRFEAAQGISFLEGI